MSRLILVRPGCTEFDEQQRIQGALDLPLSRRGRDQVAHLVKELAGVDLDLVYASPTEPALTTAEQIAAARGIPMKTLEDLVNINQGLWQGLQLEELRRKLPRVFKQWQESPGCICPPGGESMSEALDRVKQVLERPLKRKGRIAIVAADPLAGLIASIVNGTPLTEVSPICTGGCGTWEYLRDAHDGGSSAEFPVVNLAAIRPA